MAIPVLAAISIGSSLLPLVSQAFSKNTAAWLGRSIGAGVLGYAGMSAVRSYTKPKKKARKCSKKARKKFNKRRRK